MKEILYKGKKVDNGEWTEGYFYKIWNKTFILWGMTGDNPNMEEVIPETVGQYTGLKDKNGNRIFEGDIVVTRYINGEICSIGDIQFDYGVFGAEWTIHKKHNTMVGCWGQLHNLRRLDDDSINHIEVIGNIYDNPELLEVEE